MTDLLKFIRNYRGEKWVNLSHQIREDSPHFQLCLPWRKGYFHFERLVSCSRQFSVVGQYGTHIDAPIHFVEVVAGWKGQAKDLFCLW